MNPLLALILPLAFLFNLAFGTRFEASTAPTYIAQTALHLCLNSSRVPTANLCPTDFSTFLSPFNLRLDYFPAAIAVPVVETHVRDAVRCAAQHGFKVQAKGGGHSYASFSSGGRNGHLIIDLQNMTSIKFNLTNPDIAEVGGGARLGYLAETIYNMKGRALSHGTCPGVGLGGHSTHGGYGYISRYWGLAVDAIVAMDIVLANGNMVTATPKLHEDIFFAVRGAADSFGVVTKFYLQTHVAPPAVVTFNYEIPAVLAGNTTQAAKSFLSLQTFAQSTKIDSKISFGTYTDGVVFNLRGWYIGTEAEFNRSRMGDEMLAGFPKPAQTTVFQADWINSLLWMAAPDTFTNFGRNDTFYVKSIVTRENKPLELSTFESYFEYIKVHGKRDDFQWFSIINLYGGYDSQIPVKNISRDAIADRDALWIFQNYGNTCNHRRPYNPETTNFIEGLNRAITDHQPGANFGAYTNYVDPDLTAYEAAFLYYGESLYKDLCSVKRTHDPGDVFWNPQSIGNYKPWCNLSKKVLATSIDGACGSDTNTTCLGSSFGDCCSGDGRCGASPSSSCGAGCQDGYGKCDPAIALVVQTDL